MSLIATFRAVIVGLMLVAYTVFVGSLVLSVSASAAATDAQYDQDLAVTADGDEILLHNAGEESAVVRVDAVEGSYDAEGTYRLDPGETLRLPAPERPSTLRIAVEAEHASLVAVVEFDAVEVRCGDVSETDVVPTEITYEWEIERDGHERSGSRHLELAPESIGCPAVEFPTAESGEHPERESEWNRSGFEPTEDRQNRSGDGADDGVPGFADVRDRYNESYEDSREEYNETYGDARDGYNETHDEAIERYEEAHDEAVEQYEDAPNGSEIETDPSSVLGFADDLHHDVEEFVDQVHHDVEGFVDQVVGDARDDAERVNEDVENDSKRIADDLPETPDEEDLPETPDEEDLPETPDEEDLPETPDEEDLPETPDEEDLPETPDEEDLPETPGEGSGDSVDAWADADADRDGTNATVHAEGGAHAEHGDTGAGASRSVDVTTGGSHDLTGLFAEAFAFLEGFTPA